MEFDTEKLITLVEQRPALFDYTLYNYRECGLSDHLWNEIAHEMQVEVNDCKREWGKLRAQYLYHMRHKYGVTIRKKQRKEFPLEKKLYFLHKFIRAKGIPREHDDDESNSTVPQNVAGPVKNTAVEKNSSATFPTLEPKTEICDKENDENDDDLGTIDSILSAIAEEDIEEQPVRKRALRKCRVEISSTDQNFLLLNQMEAKRRSESLLRQQEEEQRKINKVHQNKTVIKQERIEPEDSNSLLVVQGVRPECYEEPTKQMNKSSNYVPPIICKQEKATFDDSIAKTTNTIKMSNKDSNMVTSKRKETQSVKNDHPAVKRKEMPVLHTTVAPAEKVKIVTHEDETVSFFKGILPDIDLLSERGLRLFKQEILLILNKTLDDQENEFPQERFV